MIFSKLLLIKVNIIHIRFAPACPHRRIRQSLRPTTQYAHSHRRHLANLAPHASYSCSIKQADSARPHTRARPRAPYIPTILRILFPRNIYSTHTPAPFILLRFLSNPLRRTFYRPARHSLLPIAFFPTPALSQKHPNRAPRCSHHFALTYSPFSCAPSKAIRQRPSRFTPQRIAGFSPRRSAANPSRRSRHSKNATRSVPPCCVPLRADLI